MTDGYSHSNGSRQPVLVQFVADESVIRNLGMAHGRRVPPTHLELVRGLVGVSLVSLPVDDVLGTRRGEPHAQKIDVKAATIVTATWPHSLSLHGDMGERLSPRWPVAAVFLGRC